MIKHSALLIFATATFTTNVQAGSIVSPGQVTEITFTTQGSPYLVNGSTETPDYLDLVPTQFGGTGVTASLALNSGGVFVTSSLYDGNNLLGTFNRGFGNGELNLLFFFGDPSANGPGNNMTDFTSILNGTIHGRIDISATGGTLDFSDLSVAGISPAMILWANTTPNSATSSYSWLTVTGVQVSQAVTSPEPSTALLMLAPLAFLLSVLRRATRVAKQKP